MRRMIRRQASAILISSLLFLVINGCAQATPPAEPTSTPPPPTASAVPPTATITPTSTATPLACLTEPGRVEEGTLTTTSPPQLYLIYLPRCYDQQTDLRYPVLYLLHGQTYTDDQWVRLGAARVADSLIQTGESPPFIIVFPDDRYWNLSAGPGFGIRLVNGLVPYVDETYRTLDDREHRALGGLSRGGGWTVFLGLNYWELFGTLGLHSPAITKEDAPNVTRWVQAIPSESWPRIWLDVGDRDTSLSSALQFEEILTYYSVPHEWHRYAGDHTETYWGQHIEQYMRWYTAAWQAETQTPIAEDE